MTSNALPVLAERRNLALPEMEQYAAQLAGVAQSGDVITLRGDLGAGKTAFARAFITRLTPSATEVTSPTFTLMQSYDVMLASGQPELLWHLDLYRLEEEGEADALGLEELERHIMLIEWPERIGRRLPVHRLEVAIEFGRDDTTRSLAISGNDAWRKRLSLL